MVSLMTRDDKSPTGPDFSRLSSAHASAGRSFAYLSAAFRELFATIDDVRHPSRARPAYVVAYRRSVVNRLRG